MRREASVAIARGSGINNEILAHPLPILLTRYERDQVALIFSYDGVPPRKSHGIETDEPGCVEPGADRISVLDSDQNSTELSFHRESHYSNWMGL